MAIDESRYTRLRRDANDRFAQGAARQKYANFISQRRFKRQAGDARQNFKSNWDNFVASYGARGLATGQVQSGRYKADATERVNDYTRGQYQLSENRQLDQQQHQERMAQLRAERQRALDDIRARRAQEIARAAQRIRALKPIVGG